MYVCVCMYPYPSISIRPSLSIYMSKYQPIYLHFCRLIWSLQRGAQHAAVRSSEASASSRPLRGPSSGGRAPGKSVRKERRLTATTMEPVMMLLLMMMMMMTMTMMKAKKPRVYATYIRACMHALHGHAHG